MRRGFGAIILVFALSAALATRAAAASAAVAVEVAGGSPGNEVTLVAETPAGLSQSKSFVLGEARGASLNLAEGEAWSVEARAHGFWSAPVRVPPGTEKIMLTLWPASELAVELQVAARGRPLPSQLDLRFSRPSSGKVSPSQPSAAEIHCGVDPRGSALCSVPAGTWDLRAKAPGFVAHYLWNQVLAPAQRVSVGRWTLQEGTSLFGRVITEQGPADPQRARVVIAPAVERDAGSAGAPSELPRLHTSLPINEWGYFHSDALPPGAYVVTARQAGFGDASNSVTMRAEADTELADPIVLQLPLRLSVVVDPPADPATGPWALELMGIRQGDLKTVARGSTDELGIWLSPALAPGLYTLRVSSRKGGSLAWTEVTLAGDSRDVLVTLDLVHVRGEVRIGDEPLEAGLWFGGRHGEVRVEAESDPDGRFEVTLPRAGQWEVDVSGRGRPVEVARVPVDVEQPRANRPAEIVIEVPNTMIHGRVVDGSRRPVEGVNVRLVGFERPEGTVVTASDAEGKFEIQGHPPGSYSIEAADSTRSSERVQVTVTQDDVPRELELVLVERRRLSGRVVSRSASVAGAFVLGFPITADGTPAAMRLPQARTALDGSFDLELPQDASRVRLVVTAPGHTLAVAMLQMAEAAGPVLVTLAQEQGTVEIALSDASAKATVPIVLVDGQALDVPMLTRWAQANGAPTAEALLTVDAMPPGSYAYCELLPAEAMLVFTGAAVPAKHVCSEGYLAPGGRLALAAPPNTAAPGGR